MKRSCFKGCFCSKAAFTLIELLVVVLIIGILAAVALPQYQKAVWKSRFSTIKSMAKALAQAEEVYYLANGSYTDRIDKLDIDLPTTPLRISETNGYGTYYYPWGACSLENVTDSASASCILMKEDVTDDAANRVLGFFIHLNHSKRTPGKITCYAYGSNQNGISYQICKNETGHVNPDLSWTDTNIYGWEY